MRLLIKQSEIKVNPTFTFYFLSPERRNAKTKEELRGKKEGEERKKRENENEREKKRKRKRRRLEEAKTAF